MATGTANESRLAELIVYVAERCAKHELFGKVKLNKVLFYADMAAYRGTGSTLTGATYIKDPFGPVPKGIEDVIASLKAEGRVIEQERSMPDLTTQKRVIPRTGPDLSSFSYGELKFVEDAIDLIRDLSANEVSEMTHRLPAWSAARMGEEIPAEALLLPISQPDVAPAAAEHGRKIAEFLRNR